MRLFVYDMLVNVIYYVHVCGQARRARSAWNSAIENLYIIIIYLFSYYWKMLLCHTRRVTMFIELLLRNVNVPCKASDNVYLAITEKC